MADAKKGDFLFDTVYFQGEPVVKLPFMMGAGGPNKGVNAASAASSASGSAAAGTFGPGQSATFTPDPTVNGPWTHTRADIPLFRSAAAAPAAPAPTAMPDGRGAATPGGYPTQLNKGMPAGPSGMQANPAFQQWRTAMDTWRQTRPSPPVGFQPGMGQWGQRPRPARRSRRDMLADAVAGT